MASTSVRPALRSGARRRASRSGSIARCARSLRRSMTRLSVRPDDAIDPRVSEGGTAVPLRMDLRALDAELEQSGMRARMMLHGRTQPTRYFAIDLRTRLLSDYATADEPGASVERIAE